MKLLTPPLFHIRLKKLFSIINTNYLKPFYWLKNFWDKVALLWFGLHLIIYLFPGGKNVHTMCARNCKYVGWKVGEGGVGEGKKKSMELEKRMTEYQYGCCQWTRRCTEISMRRENILAKSPQAQPAQCGHSRRNTFATNLANSTGRCRNISDKNQRGSSELILENIIWTTSMSLYRH